MKLQNFKDSLTFPNNITVEQFKGRAKRLSRDKRIPLSQAQNDLARLYMDDADITFSKAIKRLLSQSVGQTIDQHYEMTASDLQNLIYRYKGLTQWGFTVWDHSFSFRDEVPEDEFKRVAQEQSYLLFHASSLPAFNRTYRFVKQLKKSPSLNRGKYRDSYEMKHLVERYNRAVNPNKVGYTSHGVFIAVALFCGFLAERCGLGSNCVYFNIEESSLKSILDYSDDLLCQQQPKPYRYKGKQDGVQKIIS